MTMNGGGYACCDVIVVMVTCEDGQQFRQNVVVVANDNRICEVKDGVMIVTTTYIWLIRTSCWYKCLALKVRVHCVGRVSVWLDIKQGCGK